jgi:DNA-binding IclR family transcriptional regulator
MKPAKEPVTSKTISLLPTGKRGRTRTRDEVGVTRTLDRGLAILEVVADHGHLTLSHIARELGMSAATAFRLLETLEQRGFVARSQDLGEYRIGPRAFNVGSAFTADTRLNDVARPIMRQISEEQQESVTLAIRDSSYAVYVEQVESRSGAMRMTTRLGSRVPLHSTATGKVLLAWLWESRIDEILGPGPYRQNTEHTVTDRSVLLIELAQVRIQGYAQDAQEYESDIRCIAAPLRNANSDVIASLGISGPTGRMTAVREAVLARVVCEASYEVSRRLGWRQAPSLNNNLFGSAQMFED